MLYYSLEKSLRFAIRLNKPLPVIQSYSSYTAKNSTDVMGWKVVNTGFEVIFSKSIPTLVNTVWKPHMEMFLQDTGLQIEDIHSVIAHPGGKKVIEAMINALHIPKERLKYTYKILEDHGNMSSSTVLYVLREWLQQDMIPGNKGIVCALGPGFSSEILLLEWDE